MSDTPTIKLTYFDFHGGRGEPTRIALSIGGIPFEDDRLPGREWPSLKPSTPFGQLPVLEVDGERITQCNAINRYAGRLSGLYPEDPWEAAKCDEVSDAVESLYAEMIASFSMKGEPLQTERERLVAGPITRYLKRFGAMLEERGGEWFADGRLTVADLKASEMTRHLCKGVLDHVPTDLVERLAPNLLAHRERVLAHPGVAAYYERVLG